MPAGRPGKSERSPFGERLLVARREMGYSQIEVARKLGVTQQTYAGWECHTTALRPEHISKLAHTLGVSVDYLLGHEKRSGKNRGPVGRAHRLFEEVSKLPQRRQDRILNLVEDLLAAHRTSSKNLG